MGLIKTILEERTYSRYSTEAFAVQSHKGRMSRLEKAGGDNDLRSWNH